MKRNQVKEVKDAFFVITEIQDQKLSYMAEKNWNYLASEEKRHQKKSIALRPEDSEGKIKAFLDEQKDILKEHAKKSGDKEVKDAQGNYVIDDKKISLYEKALEVLKKKHIEAVKMIEDYNNAFMAYMNEEVDIDFYYAGR